jgi:hypothetical protein
MPFSGSSLRHVNMRDALIIPLAGHVELTIACTELLDIRPSIDTGTDDILILIPLSRSQPAGTRHVAIAVLVG